LFTPPLKRKPPEPFRVSVVSKLDRIFARSFLRSSCQRPSEAENLQKGLIGF
jgi:hypothetical protein